MDTIATLVTKRGLITAIGLSLFGSAFIFSPTVQAMTVGTNSQTQIELLQELIKTLQARLAALLGQNNKAVTESDNLHGIHVDGHILTTATLKVRDAPGVGGNWLKILQSGMHGKVVEGPRVADGYTWWKVSYGDVTGWSAANWLSAHDHAEESDD